MEFDGLQFTQISLKLIFKQAFQAQYIDKVEIWLQMTDDRNLISHTYDHSVFDTVLLIRILKKHIQDGSCIVYGSRAQGNYKKHSDIDLVIKNSKNQESHTLGPLKDALNESNFPYLVDIQFYETIKNQALKNHIDRVGQKLY
jgi:predicted nucleotidyltransferase